VPLEGISADHDNRDISIALRLPDKLVEHFIVKPKRVRVEEEGGAEAAIQIESAEGDSTILKFRSVVPPEAVNGR